MTVRNAPPQGQTSLHAERRRYFRIEDEVVLSVRRMTVELSASGADQEQPLSGSLDLNSSLGLAMQWLDRDINRQLQQIGPEHAEITVCLKSLSDKLDILARALALTQAGDSLQQAPQSVSLSASGVAFDSTDVFKAGDSVQISLLLLPGLLPIVTPGFVVHCQRLPSQPGQRVAADFVNLEADAQEQLIRHVLSKQQMQRRNPA